MKAAERMSILARDEFACLYCGARPGNAGLRLVRVIPASMGGLEVPANLATACTECAKGKGQTVWVPGAWLYGYVDRLGWVTWKRWGEWHLQFVPGTNACSLTFEPGKRDYWIDIRRVHEGDWESHIGRKTWARSDERQPTPHGLLTSDSVLKHLAWWAEPTPNAAWFDLCDGLAFCRSIVGSVARS